MVKSRRDLKEFVFEAETSQDSSTTLSHLELPLEDIYLSASQPRRYFDPIKLQKLSNSIKIYGVLEPLLVRNVANGKQELVAGERRYQAAKMAGLTHVPVIIKELNDQEALQIALVENLQREDLTPIEETEGILKLLALQLDKQVSEVIALLYRMHNEVKGQVTRNVMGNETGAEIKGIFENLGIMTWESFVRNRLPLLNLPKAILKALREGKIAYTKATAISKVKDEESSLALLEEAIAKQLSLSQIKERVGELNKSGSESVRQGDELLKRFTVTMGKLKRSLVLEDAKKQKKLEKLLTEIEGLIAEN